MNQISGATPAGPPTQAQAAAQPQEPAPDAVPPAEQPPAAGEGFGSRGRARRRLRFLRKARELAYRDLGGLVFNLHRFGQRNDPLVLDKLNTLGQIDRELRALEGFLSQTSPVTVLREAGITACPRCAAIHSSEDRFCPNCGIAMGRHADLPIAGAATPAPAPQGAQAPVAPAPPPQQPRPTSPAPPSPAPPVAPQAPPPATTAAPVAATPQTSQATQAPTSPQTAPAPAGRSPHPPTRPQGGKPGEQGAGAAQDGDELTEILRPPGPGT